MNAKEFGMQMKAEAEAAELKVRQLDAQIKKATEDKEYWQRQAEAARVVYLRIDISGDLAAKAVA